MAHGARVRADGQGTVPVVRATGGMAADYSWARPVQEYLDIYQHIRHK